MVPKGLKERLAFRHRGPGKECGHRRHIRPCTVRSVVKLQPVKSLLEGRRPTVQEMEQVSDRLYNEEGFLQEEVGSIRVQEGQPPEIQVTTPPPPQINPLPSCKG